MKAVILLFLNILFLGQASCEKSADLDLDVPICIGQKIEKIKNEEVRNPPAQVWEWNVGGEKFYYFTSDCCDRYNWLYDSGCNKICAPDGGFVGTGDQNCPEFEGEIEKTLIWEDERS